MSTIKVNNIDPRNTGETVSVNGLAMPNAGTLGNRNKIINGGMVIDQRNNGSAVTVNATTNTYTLDRWATNGQNTDGVFTVEQSSDAPAGFTKSLLVTVTTADTSIGAGQWYLLDQRIEGYNVADLNFGSADAKAVTLSFFVKSSLTGTFSGSLQNGASDRSYPFTYSISSAGTWEQKSITIPGDTSGTWLTNNGIGLFVWLDLGVGVDSRASAGAWTAGDQYGVTGSVSLISTLSATFQITGVQLEVGSKATPFEHRSYSDEFSRCERYYQSWRIVNYQAGYSVNARGGGGWVSFHTSMRAAPGTIDTTSITYSNASGLSPQEPNEGGFGSYFVLSADGTCRASYTFAADAEL